MNSYNNYKDVIMGAIASQITSLTNVYSIVYSEADQRKYQSSASLAFVQGIHRGPVNSPHKWPVTWKMFPFDDVIMKRGTQTLTWCRTASPTASCLINFIIYKIVFMDDHPHYTMQCNYNTVNFLPNSKLLLMPWLLTSHSHQQP